MYRHCRKDNGQPFYIGVGTKLYKTHLSISAEYRRAYDTKRRSTFWKNISLKYGHVVEIVYESNDENFIFQKEIEFIELYGRIDNNTGILVNHTDGGRGIVGINIERLSSQILAGKQRMNEQHVNSKKVYQYNLNGNFVAEYPCIKRAAESVNSKSSNIGDCCKGRKGTATNKGFRWFFEYKGEKIEPYDPAKYREPRRKPIVMKDIETGEVLKTFSSIKSVRNDGFCPKAVSRTLNRKQTQHSQGYRWEFIS